MINNRLMKMNIRNFRVLIYNFVIEKKSKNKIISFLTTSINSVILFKLGKSRYQTF